jgi:spore germination protein KA
MDNLIEYIKSKCKDLDDIDYRKIIIKNKEIWLVFNNALVDVNLVSNYVLRSIIDNVENKIEVNTEKKDENKLQNKIKERLNISDDNIDLENNLAINKIKQIDIKEENIFTYILSGFVLIILDNKCYVAEANASITRGISEPKNENSIRGAKDSFVENISVNVGLIRKRIKTENLVYKESKIGTKTKTKVGIMYVSSIAKSGLVKYIQEKLEKINIDGILDVNYIQEFIEEKNDSDFPVSINTERPDLVSYYLLQGRIAILVDNSPYVLVLPAFFEDYINNIDDIYQKAKNVTLTKIVRYICLILTVTVPALYLALITFDQESIPTDLLKSFSTQREGVPFPAFLEAFLMVFAFEILRESDLRSNKTSGNTLSIVGALILGDAAVSAGIVSPIMIIVVAITMISGLTFSDINIINALRKWRIIYMILASLCGLIGIGIASIFFVTSLASTNSYTKSFTYPVAPLNLTQVNKSLFSRISIAKDEFRQKILTNNLRKSRRKV